MSDFFTQVGMYDLHVGICMHMFSKHYFMVHFIG